jgi:hypothetical protein
MSAEYADSASSTTSTKGAPTGAGADDVVSSGVGVGDAAADDEAASAEGVGLEESSAVLEPPQAASTKRPGARRSPTRRITRW